MRAIKSFLTILTITVVVAANGHADSLMVPADVVGVYDGDTLTVDAYPWPGITMRTAVRVRGIDTPEIRGKCEQEKKAAISARDRMRVLVGKKIFLENITPDKYGGRVDATVLTDSGDVGRILVREKLARPYDGGKRQGWCD